jgi:predicted enzyme related to lactoylglutathione lyase
VRFTSIVFQAADVAALAHFWFTQVDHNWQFVPERGGERFAPDEEDGGTLDLVFIPATHGRTKTAKNRIHLDINPDVWQRHLDTMPLLGVEQVDIGQGELVPWKVFADPEGNEFCLLKPRDRYGDTGSVAAIVVDSEDPEPLAAFWAAATGWEIVEREADYAALRAPTSPPRGPFLEFHRVEGRNPEPSPVSLGFESYWAHQHDADLEPFLALGARMIRRHEGEVSYTVLADPEGNEFSVVIPVWPPPARSM